MKTQLLKCLLCMAAFLVFYPAVSQDPTKKYALVIGIKEYKHVQPLANSVNDARDMSALLKTKGFQVIELYDPETKSQVQESMKKFYDMVYNKKDAAGLFFYSGHGMQVDGINYLVPTGANPRMKAELDDQCVKVDFLMAAMEEAGNPLNIFILDACRNNPFRSFSRATTPGLVPVNPPTGSYVLYSTAANSVASDGTGRNGLFTSKLLKYINSPDMNIEQVFKYVARDVKTESGGQQVPWLNQSYFGDFYFTKGATPATASVVAPVKKGPLTQEEKSVIFEEGKKLYVAGRYAESVPYFRQIGELGHVSACKYMAYMHTKDLLAKDPQQKFYWNLKAAESGDASYQAIVGTLYYSGDGVEKNLNESFKWVMASANQGNKSAQYSLGRLYEQGSGTPQNKDEALKWYQKAAANGDADAKKRVVEIENASKTPVTTQQDQTSSTYVDITPEEYIAKKLKYKTRAYMTSGGKQYSAGAQGARHSPFSEKLLEAFRTYGGAYRVLTFAKIWMSVENATPEPKVGVFGDNEPGSEFVFDANSKRSGTRKDYALIIATNTYDEWNSLTTPVADATDVAEELEKNYGYTVELVINQPKQQVMSKLREYARKTYGPDDQVFIFFAGHGQFDDIGKDGYLVCKDSKKNDETFDSYIAYSVLRTTIDNYPAKHVFLTLDATFGGTFDQAIAKRSDSKSQVATLVPDDQFLERKLKFKTRLYMTSGGKQYVPDGRTGKHSPFTSKLLEGFRVFGGSTSKYLSTAKLWMTVETTKPEPKFGTFGDNEPGSEFAFERLGSSAPRIRKDYALIIATDTYNEWPDLGNPVQDAKAMAAELKDGYGFQVEMVIDGTKQEIMSKVREYAKRAYAANDQLFIFIAGHGQFDEIAKDGYLVCKDSKVSDDSFTSYIPFSVLSTTLDNNPNQHIFLCMDVCFGGTFDQAIQKR